jgi:outer membrane protein TolC
MILSCEFTHGQSLNDYLQLAAENNPGLKVKYAEFEASLQRVAQVTSLEDPRLSFGYFVSPVETRVGPQSAKISLSQMFPWFGTLKAKGEIAALNAEVKYQEFLNTKNALFRDVKSAWYLIHEVNTLLSLQASNRDILNTYKKLATTSFKNGKGSMVDVLRVDLMIDNVDVEINLLKDKKKPLIVAFNRLLNRSDTSSVWIEDPIVTTEVIDLYRKDSLLIANPKLIALDLELQSAQSQEELARKLGSPSLGLGLDYVFVTKGNTTVVDNGKDVVMPMISASVPIFRQKYKAAVAEAQFNQEAIRSQRSSYENTLYAVYEATWYEFTTAKQMIALYQSQISKSNQVITLLLASYSNTGNEFEEVLRTQQEILKYQIAETTAITKYHTALAKIDYLTSKSE